MRRLMWFAVGFTAACALGIYLSYGIWLLLAALFCIPSAIALALGSSKARKSSAAAVLGCAVCFLWLFGYDSLYLSTARQMDGKTEALSVEITDYSYGLTYGSVTEGRVQIEGKSYRVCLYLNGAQPLQPGDRVEGPFRLRYTAAGGAQKETYHQGKGIFLLAYDQDGAVITQGSPGRFSYIGPRLRYQITGLMDRLFPADVLGFARALLLGDSSLLTYAEDTAFQLSGLRHVIAVSGLHVSILFSLVYMLAGKHRGLTALLGIPVLCLFASVAGFTPSVNRACIMQGLMILAMLLKREYDPPTALSVAVATMLFVNPQAITSVSLQLSAACMVGIFLFTGRINRYLTEEKRLGPVVGKSLGARLRKWFCGSVSVTLGAMITTTPLCAWHFGCVSLVGIVSNLLALWVISFVFYGIMLSCVVGALWLSAGQFIAWCIAWPIRYVLIVAKVLSKIPYGAVYVSSIYIVAWLIFAYVLLTAFLLSKEKKPILFGSCLLLTLVLSVTASRLDRVTDPFRLTLLDVGQGQCVVLQDEDKCYLVDCGGDTGKIAANTAADYLLSMGIRHIDGIIVTHFDADHTNGIPLLLSRIGADKVYLPNVADESLVKQELVRGLSEQIQWVEPDSILTLEEGLITVFAPAADKRDNESSLCILFQPENCDILITGDRSAAGEKALLAQTDLPDLEILVAGHHGAEDATGAALLMATAPDAVLISAGRDNPYGHPSPETLERLAENGCLVLRTDVEGTIVIGGMDDGKAGK